MARMMLGAVAALTIASAAGAQGPGAPYPPPGAAPMGGMQRPPMPPPPVMHAPMGQPPMARPGPGGARWGSQVGGRWWGGVNAPGGYRAYRTPVRGYRLPGYWVAPRFYVTDWSAYGLTPPRPGYVWSRYYDDAVLIDGRGEVWDSVANVDWDRRGGYALGHEHDGYRGDRRGPDYPPPPIGRYGDGRPTAWTSADGATTVTVTTAGGPAPVLHVASDAYGYSYGGGYGSSVTTVTVQLQPVVTTTTTEIIDDAVTTRRVVRHIAVRRPVCGCAPVRRWHPRPARVIGS